MSKREELLGLNEYLAHLAKALIHADLQGHATGRVAVRSHRGRRFHRHRARNAHFGGHCPVRNLKS